MAHRLPRHAPAAPTSPGRVMTKWTKPAATASPNSMHTGRSPARSVSTMAMNPASKPALGDFFNSLLGSSCDFIARAETEDELMKQVADHAKNVHGMNEIPPEMTEKVKGAIHDEQQV